MHKNTTYKERGLANEIYKLLFPALYSIIVHNFGDFVWYLEIEITFSSTVFLIEIIELTQKIFFRITLSIVGHPLIDAKDFLL